MNSWVLMRGLTRESGHWGTFMGKLQARFPDDRIVALDLPGNGRLHDV
ncbi:hydrolase, partial [Massilia sp. JS1662]